MEGYRVFTLYPLFWFTKGEQNNDRKVYKRNRRTKERYGFYNKKH